MPVLHYFPVLGGLENWTQHIAEGLYEEADFFVITGKVKGQKKEEIKNGVNISRTSLFSLANLSYSSFFYILTTLPFIFFRSLKTIKKEKINLLHCQGFLSSLLGFLLSKATGIPYISTVQRLENDTWLKGRVYRKSAYCIAVSQAVKRYFEKIGVKNVSVIPNGIDLAKFQGVDRQKSREQLGLKDEFVVITVARLEKVKGIEFLLRAVEIFPPPNGGVPPKAGNFQLLIIGDGSQRGRLEGLAKKFGLKDKVRFLGQVQNEMVPRYLASADCFVLPSLKEGFGIAILEAMAAGLPVVASRVGGILDIIKEGYNGLLAEPGNPEALAKAIEKIYSDRFLAESLAQNAKATITQYSWPAICSQVMKIYDKN